MSKLLDNYITLIGNHKKQSELLSEMIYSVIWHKVEGEPFEKKTLIDTIKGIDILNKPSELRELIENVIKGIRVRCVDIHMESTLGKVNFRFSKKFTESLRKVLY